LTAKIAGGAQVLFLRFSQAPRARKNNFLQMADSWKKEKIKIE